MSFVKVDPDGWQAKPQRGRAWSACPSCSADLGRKSFRTALWSEYCPFCNTHLLPVWWQRVVVAVLSYATAFVIPASRGVSGLGLIFVGSLLALPFFVFVNALFFRIVPPRYVQRRDAVLTLFRH